MTKHVPGAVDRQPILSHRSPLVDANSTSRQIGQVYVLRMKQLVERTKLSRATLYVLMATDPTFPRKIKLTARSVGWLESEVDAWIISRADSECATCAGGN